MNAARIASRLRTPALRSTLQRRFASSTGNAGDNAFVRERQAVKDHAAGSTGSLLPALSFSSPSHQRPNWSLGSWS